MPKYRITYEVVKEVESDEVFPKEVIKKNLIDLKSSEKLKEWYFNDGSMKTVTIKVKSAKVIQ